MKTTSYERQFLLITDLPVISIVMCSRSYKKMSHVYFVCVLGLEGSGVAPWRKAVHVQSHGRQSLHMEYQNSTEVSQHYIPTW